MAKQHIIDQLPTAGQMKEFWGQVDTGLITNERFQEFLEENKVYSFPQETSHLRFIGKTSISATKAGPGMNHKNKHLFDWIDPDFDNWGAQTVSKDTEKATAYVYEQKQNGTYADIFGSFNIDLDLLMFETHQQIKEFVKNSPELLHPKGYATHFLYKSKSGKTFVALILRYSEDDLRMIVREFWRDYAWDTGCGHCFAILTTKTLEA